MPKVTPREPWDVDGTNRSGYMESDNDYIEHNRDAVIWFLKHSNVIRDILFPKKRK